VLNVSLIIGTRPQIIKSAPLILESQHYRDIALSIIHTGQHYDYEMSKSFFNELKLPDPHINLNVGSGSHIYQVSNIMQKLEQLFVKERPDIVLVPGDTNSTLGGALASVKMNIPVFHIESGARSGDKTMPEEMNRIIVDHSSSRHFVVTNLCGQNILNEGIPSNQIKIVGDTMYESIIKHKSDIDKVDINKYGLFSKEYLFLTIHRAENTNSVERLGNILKTISKCKNSVIFPCHPRTKDILTKTGLIDCISDRVILTEPLPYYDTLSLIKNASVVITDSGGIQKESYWLKTPCVTVRDNTEWSETVLSGSNTLVGADPIKIKGAIDRALRFGFKDSVMDENLYIQDASKRILNSLMDTN
jgi:UDP-N-acetylglucosamine 2-epimerase (non-hydrolysing)